MKLTLENDHPMYISHYQADHIKLNDKALSHSLIITPKEHQPWPVTSINSLTLDDFKPFSEAEVILLASDCGSRELAAAIPCHFAKRGVGIEIMSLGALCRTFNLLVQEGRCVVAGLIFSES
jgi:uncharacterized protein